MLLSDLGLYLRTVGVGWIAIATGAIPSLIDLVLGYYWPGWKRLSEEHPVAAGVKRLVLSLFLIGALVWAGFAAWRGEHEKRVAAEQKLLHPAAVVVGTKTPHPPGGGDGPRQSHEPATSEASQSVRVVIRSLGFPEKLGRPDQREIWMHATSEAQGLSYVGIVDVHFEFSEGDLAQAVIDKNLSERLDAARRTRPKRVVAVEPSAKIDMPLEGLMSTADWSRVSAGTRNLYAWITYSYVDENTSEGKINVSYLVAKYMQGDGNLLRMAIVAQESRPFSALPVRQ